MELMQPTEPSPAIQEIRAPIAKLGLVDEILVAIDSMRRAVRCSRERTSRSS